MTKSQPSIKMCATNISFYMLPFGRKVYFVSIYLVHVGETIVRWHGLYSISHCPLHTIFLRRHVSTIFIPKTGFLYYAQ